MRNLSLLILFFAMTAPKSFCQYISVSTKDKNINALFAADDSTFNKIVDRVYFTGTVREQRNKTFLLDVTKYVNGIIELPDSLKTYTLQQRTFKIVFKGYLYEFLHEDLSEKANKNDSLLIGFTDKEKKILYALKELTLDESFFEHGSSQSVIVFGSNGLPRMEYFEVAEKRVDVSVETVNQPIEVNLTYSPVYADIYFIPETDWIFKYHLTKTPVTKQVTKIMNQLLIYKAKQVKNPLKIDLEEQTYVIIYDRHSGQLKFDFIQPSTRSKTNNTISVNLNE